MIKVLTAFLAGVATGLLFAPQSGKKTRNKISGIFNNADDALEFESQYAAAPDQNFYENIKLADKTTIEPFSLFTAIDLFLSIYFNV